MDDTVNFEQLIQFRVPTKFLEAIDFAAKQRCQSKSEYIRQSVLENLKVDGIDPASLARAG